MLKKRGKNVDVFQIVGRDQMEESTVVPFLGLKDLSNPKRPSPRACYSTPRECRLVPECDEILQGREFGPESRRGLIAAQRY
jgi:hypothetical protein